jgi:hypothetical protein
VPPPGKDNSQKAIFPSCTETNTPCVKMGSFASESSFDLCIYMFVYQCFIDFGMIGVNILANDKT